MSLKTLSRLSKFRFCLGKLGITIGGIFLCQNDIWSKYWQTSEWTACGYGVNLLYRAADMLSENTHEIIHLFTAVNYLKIS